jgi:hypothetical protein
MRLATLRGSNSSRSALLSAVRSTVQASRTVRSGASWRQHWPIAQHFGSSRCRSLPWAQQRAVVAGL